MSPKFNPQKKQQHMLFQPHAILKVCIDLSLALLLVHSHVMCYHRGCTFYF